MPARRRPGFIARVLGTADLQPRDSFPRLTGQQASTATWLDEVFAYADDRAVEASEWYLTNKARKRWGGVMLRFAAIVLAGAAGTWPLFVGFFSESELAQAGWLPPEAASLFAGAAGLAILVDRFLGLTSGWMRYVQAQQEIDRMVERFRADWSTIRAQWHGREPTHDELKTALTLVKAFQSQVHGVVARETEQWVQEFKAVLKSIESRVEQQREPEAAGAVTVVLDNLGQLDGGWRWRLDQGEPRVCTGPTDTVSGVVPGLHTITVQGRVRRTERSLVEAEVVRAITVEPGQPIEVRLTLE